MVREKYAGLFDAGSADRGAAEALAAKTYELIEFLEMRLGVDPSSLKGRPSAPLTCHDACHLRGLHRRRSGLHIRGHRQPDGPSAGIRGLRCSRR
jgi:hypothetical protein